MFRKHFGGEWRLAMHHSYRYGGEKYVSTQYFSSDQKTFFDEACGDPVITFAPERSPRRKK